MIDLHWAEHALGVLDAAARVRAAWSGARIVVGGLTATRFAAELLQISPEVDGVVVGDAEGPIAALASAIEEGCPWPPATPNLRTRGAPPVSAWRRPCQ